MNKILIKEIRLIEYWQEKYTLPDGTIKIHYTNQVWYFLDYFGNQYEKFNKRKMRFLGHGPTIPNKQ